MHRDIKPANILLSPGELDDRAYVADFGLALKTEDVQFASQIAGTPAFMSPEQITGDVSQLDGRSDIFSLGVVFYELLVGERPFRGNSLVDLLTNIRSGIAKPPDRCQRDVPLALSAICMKCLAKRPADRFQTAKQLANALHRWLTLEEGVPAAPELRSPPQGQAFPFVRVLVGVVLGVALVWFLPKGSGSKPPAVAASPNPPVRKKVVTVPQGFLEESARRGINPFDVIDRNPDKFKVRYEQ